MAARPFPRVLLALLAAGLAAPGCARCRRAAPPPAADADESRDGGGVEASRRVSAEPTRVVEADGTIYQVYEPQMDTGSAEDSERLKPVRREFFCPGEEQLEPSLPDPQPDFDMDDLRELFPGLGRDKVPVTISTEQGRIECEVWPDAAPQAAALFLGLATGARAWWHPCSHAWVTAKPYYDESTFHLAEPTIRIGTGCLYKGCEAGAGIRADLADMGQAGIDRPGLMVMPRNGPAGAFSVVDCEWQAPEPTRLIEGECRLTPDATRLVQDHVVFGVCPHKGLVHGIYRLARVVPDSHQDSRAVNWIRPATADGEYLRFRPPGEAAPADPAAPAAPAAPADPAAPAAPADPAAPAAPADPAAPAAPADPAAPAAP